MVAVTVNTIISGFCLPQSSERKLIRLDEKDTTSPSDSGSSDDDHHHRHHHRQRATTTTKASRSRSFCCKRRTSAATTLSQKAAAASTTTASTAVVASAGGPKSKTTEVSTTSAATSIRRSRSFDEKLQELMARLSEEEVETAARTSYEYLQDPALADRKGRYAEAIARNYLISKKGNTDQAFRKLQATLAFREKMDMDGLRRTFQDPTSEYQKPLSTMLASWKNYVMGYDKEGRSTYIFVPRNTQTHDSEWTLKESLYTMERAIACSKASDRSVNAILDFNGFSPIRHAPPIGIGKEFVLTLRNHYAGQMHKIFIVDAPSSFEWFWKLFKPFVGQSTQDKIVFVSGTTPKETILGRYYDPEQAASFMLPKTGTKTRELDIEEYLYRTSFDRAFDE